MKVAENFDLREFVSPDTWKKWGKNSRWFVDQRVIDYAQYCKGFFTYYFKKNRKKKVKKVTITINNWLWKGNKVGRGYREPKQYNSGQFKKTPNSESLHRQGKAVDQVVTIYYEDGTTEHVKSKELLAIIQQYWTQFKTTGVTTIEDPAIAPTWLHSDFRNTQSEDLLIVGG